MAINQNLKRFIGYLAYVAAFGFLVIWADSLQKYYKHMFSTTFQIPYLWVFFAMIGLPILIGIGLALPQFIKTARQEGAWRVDWIRLLTMGLPGFLFALALILSMVNPELMTGIKLYSNLIAYHQTLVKAAGILLGFVLLNSFYKQIDS